MSAQPVQTLVSLHEACEIATRKYFPSVLAKLIADYTVHPFRGWESRLVFQTPAAISDAIVLGADSFVAYCPDTQQIYRVEHGRVFAEKADNEVVLEHCDIYVRVYMRARSSEFFTQFDKPDRKYRLVKGICWRNLSLIEEAQGYCFRVRESDPLCISRYMVADSARLNYSFRLITPKTIVCWNGHVVVISSGEIVWLNEQLHRPIVPPLKSDHKWTSLCVLQNQLYATSGCGIYALSLR